MPRKLCRHLQKRDTNSLEPCTPEEADTCLMLHVADCAKEGHHKLLIRTTDTDVVVLTVSCVHKVTIKELCIAFGVGKNYQHTAVHQIAAQLGPNVL